jgi:4-amino-4-deoxy-L-arabinose transferase-like glycosyltransferase
MPESLLEEGRVEPVDSRAVGGEPGTGHRWRARARRAVAPLAALPRTIARDRVLQALTAILAAGVALRVWLMLVWSPAFTGYSDTGIYFQDSIDSIWSDPIRTQGYTMFLRLLHGISPHLILVTIVQHALGLVAAVLVFLTVRRLGGPRWLGLIPAAALALAGDSLFIEHAALSDSLLIFLLVAMLYCAVRTLDGGLPWAAATGLLVGLGVWERGASLAMAAIVPLWLLFSAGRPSRRTLALGAVTLAAAIATVGAYVGWRKADSGLPGLLSTNNAWNLYGRVGPWADCTKFTPPAGTRGLCESTPVSERGYRNGGEDYIYNTQSPAQRLFGHPYEISSYPHAMELLQSWSEAAILGQPLDYLHAVWLDTIRLFEPNAHSYSDMSADEMTRWFLYGPEQKPPPKNQFVEYWQVQLYPHDPPPHYGDIAPLRSWEEATRLDGAWMALLLALCLTGPWLLGRRARELAPRARAGMILFGLTALAMLFFPILVKGYDYRFVIPAYAPLVAAATLAGWGLALRLAPLAARMRRRPAAVG